VKKFNYRVLILLVGLLGLGIASPCLAQSNQIGNTLQSALSQAQAQGVLNVPQRSGSTDQAGPTPIVVTQYGQNDQVPGPLRVQGGEQVLIEVTLRDSDEDRLAAGGVGYQTASDDKKVKHTNGVSNIDPETLQFSVNGVSDNLIKKQQFVARIMAKNPYEIDRLGFLNLPGIKPISLSGLTEAEARQRLNFEPALAPYVVNINIVKVTSPSRQSFGYDFFKKSATAIIPGSDIPAPDDYRLGEGDRFNIQTTGRNTTFYSTSVSRDGYISTPDLGPISVAGRTYAQARSLVEAQVARNMVGTQVKVTLSELRSARVLVLGEVERPGSYVVAALSSPISVLFTAGGIKTIGSLRNVEVRRNGQVIKKIDLYDAFLKGIVTSDVRLVTGDVVFVPPIGPIVQADGEVVRPGVYELQEPIKLKEFIEMVGGVTGYADWESGRLTHTDKRTGIRSSRTLDLRDPTNLNVLVSSGDSLTVDAQDKKSSNEITISGGSFKTGVAYRQGLRLTDVIKSQDELVTKADLNYVLIKSVDPTTGHISVVSTSLRQAIANPSSAANISLKPKDHIHIFGQNVPRDDFVGPLISEIEGQAGPTELASEVKISGEVHLPNTYPLERSMRVSDLLRAGGGLKPSANTEYAELSRVENDGNGQRVKIINIDLNNLLTPSQDNDKDLLLQPYDHLVVRRISHWGEDQVVEIAGEVRYPGRYIIQHGEKLSHLIERAGGVTETAFLEAGIFLRQSLKEREREQIEKLAKRVQAALTVESGASLVSQSQVRGQAVTTNNASGNEAVIRGILDELRDAKPTGRMVIDLKALLERHDAEADVTLTNGDSLVIPIFNNEVTVLGEVQNPSSFRYKYGMSVKSTIALSGGLTENARRKQIYVVGANGAVELTSSLLSDKRLAPGDTVVVPLDTERLPVVVEWQGFTNILYNLAVTAVSLKTVGIL
jgi:polysaccharide biosynthesis/export protein